MTLTGLLCSSLPLAAQGPPAGLPPGLGGRPGAPAPAIIEEESPATSTASRFINPEDLADRITGTIQKLSISSRKTDPFGQVQDPAANPPVIKPTVTNRNPNQYKATAFSDVVSKIQINTIMPSENRFLIGTRSFKLGDNFPLSFRGKKIDVKVVGVSAQKIDFQKTDTGEIASVKLSLMPAGMSSGKDGVTAPGMVVDDKSAPLQLDNPSPGF